MNKNKLEEYLKSPEYLKLVQEKTYFLKKLFSQDNNYKSQMLGIVMKDIVKFAKLCLVLYEPRSSLKKIIFNPFPYQIELWKKLDELYQRGQGEIYVEKARDIGVTWAVLAWIFHKWLTVPNFTALIGSRKESEVDNKTINSLFGKLRYFLYHLPPNFIISAKKFKKKLHDNHMRLINPTNGSLIEGESSNPNFGRGKRASVVFCDEVLFWPFIEESMVSLYDSAPIRIFVSTPSPTDFARRFVEDLRKQGKVLTLHWQANPFKDQEWYNEEIKVRSSITTAITSEIELSYDPGIEKAYYPEAYACRTADLYYDSTQPLYIGLDTATYRDYTAIIWAQYINGELRILEALLSHGRLVPEKNLIDWFLPFFSPNIPILIPQNYYADWEWKLLQKVRQWREPEYICGEVNLKQVAQGWGRSWYEYLIERFKEYGVQTRIETNDSGIPNEKRREAVAKFIRQMIFAKNSYGALKVLDALKSTTKKVSKTGNKIHPENPEGLKDLRAATENLCLTLDFLRSFQFRVVDYVS